MVVVRSDSQLGAGASTVTLKELAGVPLISYAQMREAHLIENRLGHPALRDQIVFRSNENGTILGLAAEGVGAAVLPWLSVDPYRTGIRVLQIAGVSRRIVERRRGRSAPPTSSQPCSSASFLAAGVNSWFVTTMVRVQSCIGAPATTSCTALAPTGRDRRLHWTASRWGR